MHSAGCRERSAAARHAVRADPLERADGILRARRSAGGALHRCVFRPAREQGDAGVDRAPCLRPARLRAVANSAGSAVKSLVVARGDYRRLTPPSPLPIPALKPAILVWMPPRRACCGILR